MRSRMESLEKIAKELIIIPNEVIRKILLGENVYRADALSLYLFYYYKARVQKTNKPWVTDKYVKKVLGWGKVRFKGAQNILLDNNLIKKIPGTTSSGGFNRAKNGRFITTHIEINKILKNSTATALIKANLEKLTVGQNPHAVNSHHMLKVYREKKKKKRTTPLYLSLRSDSKENSKENQENKENPQYQDTLEVERKENNQPPVYSIIEENKDKVRLDSLDEAVRLFQALGHDKQADLVRNSDRIYRILFPGTGAVVPEKESEYILRLLVFFPLNIVEAAAALVVESTYWRKEITNGNQFFRRFLKDSPNGLRVQAEERLQ